MAAHMDGKHLQEFADRRLLTHGIACQLAQMLPVDMPRPVNDGADIAFDRAPITKRLPGQGRIDALLHRQQEILIHHHHTDGLNCQLVT